MIVGHRLLTEERRAENARISAEAISLAQAADTRQGNGRLQAVLDEIASRGGLGALPAAEYEKLWRRLTSAMRQQRG
jgi:hypothetical protein